MQGTQKDGGTGRGAQGIRGRRQANQQIVREQHRHKYKLSEPRGEVLVARHWEQLAVLMRLM